MRWHTFVFDDEKSRAFLSLPPQVRMVPGKPGIAFVEYGTEAQAAPAKDTLQGFKLTPTNAMRITYAKKT